MDISSGDISAMVFRRIVRDDLGEFSLDGQMLSILMELDGRTRLGTVAKKIGQNLDSVEEVIRRLLDMRLVEPVEDAISMLDRDFFDYLNTQMARAVGPVGEVLVEDAVADLGCTMTKFPSHRAAELVDMLARQIKREEKRTAFKQNLVNKIKEKGY